VLDLVASCPEGCCIKTLMLAYGFTIEQMVQRVRGNRFGPHVAAWSEATLTSAE
jgi:hypothetical protein